MVVLREPHTVEEESLVQACLRSLPPRQHRTVVVQHSQVTSSEWEWGPRKWQPHASSLRRAAAAGPCGGASSPTRTLCHTPAPAFFPGCSSERPWAAGGTPRTRTRCVCRRCSCPRSEKTQLHGIPRRKSATVGKPGDPLQRFPWKHCRGSACMLVASSNSINFRSKIPITTHRGGAKVLMSPPRKGQHCIKESCVAINKSVPQTRGSGSEFCRESAGYTSSGTISRATTAHKLRTANAPSDQTVRQRLLVDTQQCLQLRAWFARIVPYLILNQRAPGRV